MPKIGDIVSVNDEGNESEDLTPRRLVEAGFQNAFHVVNVRKYEGEDVLTLAECCGNIVDPQTGEPLCTAHWASMFDVVSHEPATKLETRLANEQPHRELALDSPIGRLFQFGYFKRGKQGEPAQVIAAVPGLKPFGINGPLAEFVGELLKDNKII